MKITNEIAILISWPRELDMFSTFIENTIDNVVIVVDDFVYDEGERFEKGIDINSEIFFKTYSFKCKYCAYVLNLIEAVMPLKIKVKW